MRSRHVDFNNNVNNMAARNGGLYIEKEHRNQNVSLLFIKAQDIQSDSLSRGENLSRA